MDRGAALLVAAGGFAGSIARYAVAVVVGGPAATLAANVVGRRLAGALG